MKKSLFFTELHVIFTEGFLELLISTILTLKQRQMYPFGETLSIFIAIFSLLVFCIQLPWSFYMILRHDKVILALDENFISTHGVLYKNTRYDSVWQRLYTVTVLLRRTVIVILALLFDETPGIFQLFVLISVNYLQLIYNGSAEPFNSVFERVLQQYNELTVALCSLTLFAVHPDWNMRGQDRVPYSWLLVSIMQLMILVNMVVILSIQIKSTIMLLKRKGAIRVLRRLSQNTMGKIKQAFRQPE